ncbi:MULTISPECIES: restriction endonuclease subunit S [unclassified Flavobacterium]|uniref:restriction endonuclease subunit S n=1 Tax=unclassified Flavobacterium TaxID=196869 RepID=UPI00131B2750|nr:restriction endonuclease subunit S [Flavobacterium sp. I-STPP5a]
MNSLNVPKLRFPGFDGEWEKNTLGEAFTIFNGYAFSSTSSVDEGVLWVKIADVGIQEMKKNNLSYLPASLKEKHKKFIISKGDFVVALTRPILNGKLKIAQINSFFDGALLNQRVGKIVSNNSHYFIYSLLQKDELIKFIENNIAGSDPPNLSPNEINSIEISYPPLPEQQKIASFLSSVDEKIHQLSRKVALLEQYKKGVMQQLFSGKLRFKDENGKEYPDWEEKKLGDVATKKSSNISANKIEDNFGEFIIYGASGILKKVDFYKEESDYISIVKDGAGVGRLLYCKGKSSVLGTMEIISPKQNIDTYFLYCLLSNIDFVKYVTGSTIPHIYFKDYSNEICGIPSIKEQQKIANFLSGIDGKIEKVNGELVKTQEFKKGLLQQMFV